MPVGRLSEAAQPMKPGLEMGIEQENWKVSAINASNLSELYLTLGEVALAVNYGAQSVSFADRSGDGFQMESKRTTHAHALHQSGENKAAEKLFREAEAMQKKRRPEYPYLFSLRGFNFCKLLLSMGKYQIVLEQARTTLNQMQNDPNAPLLTIVVDKLTIGKALLQESLDTSGSPRTSTSEASVLSTSTPLSTGLVEAEDYLNQAVDGLREAGDQQYLPLGLFARATLLRHLKAFPKAWADLSEALEIATYGQMPLHLTNYHLEAARLIQAQLAQTKAPFTIIEDGLEQQLSKTEMTGLFKTHVNQAATLIQKTGYHRRDGELAELDSSDQGAVG